MLIPSARSPSNCIDGFGRCSFSSGIVRSGIEFSVRVSVCSISTCPVGVAGAGASSRSPGVSPKAAPTPATPTAVAAVPEEAGDDW